MKRTLTATAESWPLERPFAISRGVKTAADVVVVTLEQDGVRGRAECVPYPRYDESVASVLAQIARLSDAVEAGMGRDELQHALEPGAARNALDCALWDLEAKRAGKPVWELAGLAEPGQVVTAETIGIDTPAAMGARAAELADAPLLKVKLDAEDVIERLRAVRAGAPDARLIVDPNEGWDVALLAELLRALGDLGVEMLEQPVPAGRDGGLRAIASPVPLCADEACHARDDLVGLAGKYSMVNIKLDKTGGLTEALALKAEAEAKGFAIMVGCMVGTSLAMAPALLVAQGAAIVDLDGPLLLKRDREPGLRFDGRTVWPPEPALWG